MNLKTIKETVGALKGRQAVTIGKELPAKLPKGVLALTFGKSYALQNAATNSVDSLPGKLAQAAKQLAETGGVVSNKVIKAAGLSMTDLYEKLSNNKAVVISDASNSKFTVTVRAKRSDLVTIGEATATPAKGGKKAAEAKPAKATKETKPAKAQAAPKKGEVKKAGKKEAEAQPKRRGRPPGSANKPKADDAKATKAKASGKTEAKAKASKGAAKTAKGKAPAKGKGRGK